MANITFINCTNCNKELLPGEKELAEKNNFPECATCLWHTANGTRTIEAFNKWLAGKPWRK